MIQTNWTKRFDLDQRSEFLDEKTLLSALSRRIQEMLDLEIDLLMSTLYRLDVREHDIKLIMSGSTGESISDGLARLVIERQIEKQQTGKNFSGLDAINDLE